MDIDGSKLQNVAGKERVALSRKHSGEPLHPDEQARELALLDIKAAWHCPQCRRDGEAEVRALLAKARFAEAEWWRPRTDLRHDDDCLINLPFTNPASDFCTCDVTKRLKEADARLAELMRQAAGEGTKP